MARYWSISTAATAVPLSAQPSLIVITTKLAAAILGGSLFGGGVLPAQYCPCELYWVIAATRIVMGNISPLVSYSYRFTTTRTRQLVDIDSAPSFASSLMATDVSSSIEHAVTVRVHYTMYVHGHGGSTTSEFWVGHSTGHKRPLPENSTRLTIEIQHENFKGHDLFYNSKPFYKNIFSETIIDQRYPYNCHFFQFQWSVCYDVDFEGPKAVKACGLWLVILYYDQIFIFAVLERWLIYDCETECSFVYVIFAVLLHKFNQW